MASPVPSMAWFWTHPGLCIGLFIHQGEGIPIHTNGEFFQFFLNDEFIQNHDAGFIRPPGMKHEGIPPAMFVAYPNVDLLKMMCGRGILPRVNPSFGEPNSREYVLIVDHGTKIPDVSSLCCPFSTTKRRLSTFDWNKGEGLLASRQATVLRVCFLWMLWIHFLMGYFWLPDFAKQFLTVEWPSKTMAAHSKLWNPMKSHEILKIHGK